MIKLKILQTVKFLSFFLVAIFFLACSSTKVQKKYEQTHIEKDTLNNEQNGKEPNIEIKSKNIESFECNGQISLLLNGEELKGSFEIQSIKNRIFLLDIFGPFGINVARIYSDTLTNVFCNIWQGKYYKNKEGIENFEFLSPMPQIFFKIFTAEPFLQNFDNIQVTENQDTLSFNQLLDNNANVHCFYLNSLSSIIKIIVNYKINNYQIIYNNFANYGNYGNLPLNIVIQDVVKNDKITLQIESFDKINAINEIKSINLTKYKEVSNFNELFSN
jgi:hypothetical protein